ncbi:MAG: FtsX-like permease family protein [Holophagaceae bacterium]
MKWSWLSYRMVIRNFKKEFGRTLLALLSVALGVSVFLAIRLANRSAISSFTSFTRGVGQGSDYVLRSPVGSIQEEILIPLNSIRSSVWMRPVLEGSFSLKSSLESFQILGTDLVGLNGELEDESDADLRSNRPEATTGDSALNFYDSIQTPNGVLVSQTFLESTGLEKGSVLEGFIDDKFVSLIITGVLKNQTNRPALERNLFVMDLPALQTLLGRTGELDRIDIGIRSYIQPSEAERLLQSSIPKSLILEPAEQRASSGRTMSSAFRFNLTILSLIALAVGGYLLFQSFDSTVNRRRDTWATLVALGSPPLQIQSLVLLESFILGSLGSILGIALGWILAQGAVRGVSQTLDALYGASAASHANFYWDEVGIAFILGLGTCFLAAWIPARRASTSSPIQFLSKGSETRPINWTKVLTTGCTIFVFGLLVAYLPSFPPGVAWHAYLGSFSIIVGGSLVAVGCMPLLGLVGKISPIWWLKLSLRPLSRPTGRHAFAAAALAVAVGMTVGMGIMVKSFEGTVQAWIGTSLHADLYIAPIGAVGAASKHRIDPKTANAIEQDLKVEAVDRFQILPIDINGSSSFIGAGDLAVELNRRTMMMVEGGDTQAIFNDMIQRDMSQPGAIISETFSRRFGVRLHQELLVPTPSGVKKLEVMGIFADYGNERGSIIMHRPFFVDWFNDDRSASLAVYLKPGAQIDIEAKRLAKIYPGLQVRSNRSLRDEVSRIFNQTFAITYALEIIGCIVAVIGLVQALLGLALKRRNEIWSLRSLGANEKDISWILIIEGLGIALSGLAAGTLLGLALSRILVDILNPQVFGWTLKFVLPWSYMVMVAGLLLVAVILSLIPTARWSAQLKADRKIEEGA